MEGIALHGIGINFKSAISQKFIEDHPNFSLNLSTHSKLREIRNVLGVGTHLTTSDRLTSRLVTMTDDKDCIYDRTCIDEWIFANMNYQGINWYYDKEKDPGIESILENVDGIIKYESRFVTQRILIVTKNKKLLKENINLDSEHNRLRFDLYENLEQYFHKQSVFCTIFKSLQVEYDEVVIPDDGSMSLSELFENTYEQILRIYNHNTKL